MFKDINPLFQGHPDTHDITVRTDVGAINGSISNLVLTNIYERPYNKLIAGNIYKQLFEQPSTQMESLIETTITQLISNFEPRAYNVAVSAQVNSTGDGYIVDVAYNATVSGKQGSLTLGLNKTR